jgi:hypothetical protein
MDKNHVAATNLTSDFDNRHLSYFAGLDADELRAQSETASGLT